MMFEVGDTIAVRNYWSDSLESFYIIRKLLDTLVLNKNEEVFNMDYDSMDSIDYNSVISIEKTKIFSARVILIERVR